MRKFTCLVLLISGVAISLNAFGQSKGSKLSEQEVKAMLCNKWITDSIQMNGEKVSAKFAGIDNTFIHFHNNGTFSTESTRQNNKNLERWYYNHNTQTVTTGGVPKEIVFINYDKLVLFSNDGGEKVSIILKRAN